MGAFLEINGQKYSIDMAIITIGSEDFNNIIVDPNQIKDKEATIIIVNKKPNEYILKPSHPNLMVNNKVIKEEYLLKNNDIISLNNLKIRFIEEESSILKIGELKFDEFLLNLFNTLQEIFNSNSIDKATLDLLKFIYKLFDASAVRIVIEENNKFKNLYTFPENLKNKDFSQSVLSEAKKLSKTILMKSIESDKNYSESIYINEISSIICSKLDINIDKINNAYIYIDKRKDKGLFTENDRYLLESFKPIFEILLKLSYENIEKEKKLKSLMEKETKEAELIYADKKMEEIIKTAEKIAKIDIPVLITGPTGSGKEKIAKFIHYKSLRKDKPFVAVNCGAIPENLLESELFGYKKGAFTGADKDKKGLFEMANGGTLFLDEIGELPLYMQVKLLRVLQEGKILPLGATQEIPIDVRIISATNRNLEEEIKQGKFREDLYYRINGFKINLPPLKDRPEDIILLSEYFIEKYSKEFKLPSKKLSEKAKQKLLNYSWPGNVRELEMVIKKALVLSESNTIKPEDILISETLIEKESKEKELSLSEIRDNTMREAIIKYLKLYHGNISKAARALKTERKSFIRIMQRLGIDANEFRD